MNRTANAVALKPCEDAELTTSLIKQELVEGEVYIGAIIGANGHGHHVILLEEHQKQSMKWSAAMDWAKSIGGDLPNRIEQTMLFDQHKSEFDNDWYWSNAQHAADPGCAWSQLFLHGYQFHDHKDCTLRARAVRRVLI